MRIVVAFCSGEVRFMRIKLSKQGKVAKDSGSYVAM